MVSNKLVKCTSSIMVLALVCMVASCSDSSKGPTAALVNGEPVYQSQIDAYFKVKGIKTNDPQKIEKLVNDFLEREALADQISKEYVLDMGVLEAEVREFRKELLISRHLQKYTDDNVSEEALRNYYQNNKSEFTKDLIKVSHVLVRTKPNMTDLERQRKQTQINTIHNHLLEGQRFNVVAQKYSEDQASAKNGGSLGWLGKGAISKEFSEKIFAMEVGQVSDPFETRYGFHIVQIDEGKKQQETPYDRVKGDIRYQLRQKAKATEVERLNNLVTIEYQE